LQRGGRDMQRPHVKGKKDNAIIKTKKKGKIIERGRTQEKKEIKEVKRKKKRKRKKVRRKKFLRDGNRRKTKRKKGKEKKSFLNLRRKVQGERWGTANTGLSGYFEHKERGRKRHFIQLQGGKSKKG